MNKNDPVAFFDPHKGFYWAQPTKITAPVVVNVEPLALYTQRTWVGLTDEEVVSLLPVTGHRPATTFARSVEAALRSKNT